MPNDIAVMIMILIMAPALVPIIWGIWELRPSARKW